MTSAAALASDAARLVSFALRPKVALGSPDSDYYRLWHEYRVNEEFRDVVEAVVDGLGLVTLGVTEQGLLVAPSDDSPFQFRLSDLQKGLAPDRRLLIGVAHLGIAAAAYPREADLEGDIVVRRSATQIESLLRTAVEAFADGADDDEADDLTTAWRVFRSTPAVRRKDRGSGFRADCTMGVITNAFDWLVEQGMARRAGDGVWQLLDRYRVQVRELAGHTAFETLRGLAEARADLTKPADTLDSDTDDQEA
jgi:hypothetical protein